MAEKLSLGSEVKQLKIGQSFTNPKSSAFHSIKYDFKPASVDTNKIATVDVGSNHQVTVTVPHLDGAGVPQTVFKGSQRPYQKECVLIIDRTTGEITLEKLSCNIQVKKTRSEPPSTKLPSSLSSQDRLGQGNNDRSGTTTPQQQQTTTTTTTSSSSSSGNLSSRSQTPPIGQRISHKTKVTSGSRRPDRPITHLVPKHSPLHASPSYPSPGHPNKSPKRDIHNENHNPSALASLPMIGMDDFDPPPPSSNNNNNNTNSNHQLAPPPPVTITTTDNKSPIFALSDTENGVIGEITDTSSSSSDSDSEDSDPDNTVIDRQFSKTNGHSNGIQQQQQTPKLATHLLTEDLCLSESGSDSD